MSLEIIDEVLLVLKNKKWVKQKELENEISIDEIHLKKILDKMEDSNLIKVDKKLNKIKATELGRTSLKNK